MNTPGVFNVGISDFLKWTVSKRAVRISPPLAGEGMGWGE